MKQPILSTLEERMGYQKGFKAGYSEGLKKATMLIQLVAMSNDDFTNTIIQNSPEAIELRRIITGSEEV